MLHGCDVWEQTYIVDVTALLSAVDFIIIRRGYGVTRFDAQSERIRNAARSAHKPVMNYWYVVPDAAPALIQATVIAVAIASTGMGEPLALDVEEDSTALIEQISQIAMMLSVWLGKPPLIYTNSDFLYRYDWSRLARLGCGLWLAQWNNSDAPPEQTAPFAFAAFKQYTCTSTLPGVRGSVCLNAFYGTAEQFRMYA